MPKQTPLDFAMMLERSGERDLPRNGAGLFVCMGTVPPTELTLREYESALKVLDFRERVRAGGVAQ